MPSRNGDLGHARRVLDDVAWLSSHRSFVQAAQRLGEVVRDVEHHLNRAEEALRRSPPEGGVRPGGELRRIRKEHRRLLGMVENVQVFVSRSDPGHCEARLRQLARSLERHQHREHALLSQARRQKRTKGLQ